MSRISHQNVMRILYMPSPIDGVPGDAVTIGEWGLCFQNRQRGML